MTQEGIEGYDSLYDMTNISLLYSYVSDLHHSRCQLKISGNSSRTHLVANRLGSIRCEKYRVAKGPMGGRERTKCERTRSRNIQTPFERPLLKLFN